MHLLNMARIGEMAEGAGKCRSSRIDVLGMVRGRVSGCHRPRRPLVRCVRIGRGLIDRPGRENRKAQISHSLLPSIVMELQ